MSDDSSVSDEGGFDFDSIDFEFIKKQPYSDAWADYIKARYRDILNKFETHYVPGICNKLCDMLKNRISACDYESERYDFAETMLRIARRGLHAMCTPNKFGITSICQSDCQNYSAYLYYFHACALYEMNRPIAARRYLNNAKAMILTYLRTLPCKDESDKHVIESWASTFDLYDFIQFKGCIEYYRFIPDAEVLHYLSFINENFKRLQNEFTRYGVTDYDQPIHKIISSMDGAIEHCGPDFDSNMVRKSETLPVSDYLKWCGNLALCINFAVEASPDKENWIFDMKSLDFGTYADAIYMDICSSYDHCRRLLFKFINKGLERYSMGRDDDVESLIDCYYRLHSILDKAAKVINDVFALGFGPDIKFKQLVSKIENNTNCYLRAICNISKDIFPRSESFVDQDVIPFMFTFDGMNKPSTIRNHIAHDGFRIVTETEKPDSVPGLLSITVKDLESHVTVLLFEVREVILTIFLAMGE